MTLTDQQQGETNEELPLLGNKWGEGTCSCCLPNLIQRHWAETESVDVAELLGDLRRDDSQVRKLSRIIPSMTIDVIANCFFFFGRAQDTLALSLRTQG